MVLISALLLLDPKFRLYDRNGERVMMTRSAEGSRLMKSRFLIEFREGFSREFSLGGEYR